jgi:citrate synthase
LIERSTRSIVQSRLRPRARAGTLERTMNDLIARGLEGVVLTETRLSGIDGETGELSIGGFPVEELAPRARFEEVAFLLWHDRLPLRSELERLELELHAERALPDETHALLEACAARGSDPMDALRMGLASLSLAGIGAGEATLSDAKALVARVPVLAAAYARRCAGRAPVAPRADLGHAANFLWMLDGANPDDERVRALETYLNTVVDHGMNASTFTARVITSTRSDLVSAVTGAIGALKGPAHGGAPGPALEMVFEIRARAAASGRPLALEAEGWLRGAIAAGERIMGFGHRVYRVRDPRADVLADVAERLAARSPDPALHRDAIEIEAIVLRVLELAKPGRRLATNVEFYTALALHEIGLPTALFTPAFAVGRVAGWTAHALEQARENRLIRPRVVYRGERARRWVPPDARL